MSQEEKYCDLCGRSLLVTNSADSTFVMSALQISLTLEDSVVKQVLGPYENREYNFCYICILQKLGVESDDKT